MYCPKCGSEDTAVIECRPRNDGKFRRRRSCCDCGHRFTTIEINIGEYENLKELAASFKKLLTLAKILEE
jgi:transcriptional regulator NrdR family protein